MFTDHNNNMYGSKRKEGDADGSPAVGGGSSPPEETEMSLSYRNGELHLYNPCSGSWVPVTGLHTDKKVYLYNAMAANGGSQLKDVIRSVRRLLGLSEASVAFQALASIPFGPEELGVEDERSVYRNGLNCVKHGLQKLEGLHEDLDLYCGRLAGKAESNHAGFRIAELGENGEEASEAVGEEKVFIGVPWDWGSPFLTGTELPTFSKMASKAVTETKPGFSVGETPIRKSFKRPDRPPPMEPTWMARSETASGVKDPSETLTLSLPCVVLRNLGLSYGSSGETYYDFDLVIGSSFRNSLDPLNFVLPTNSSRDSIKKFEICPPIAFRSVDEPGELSLEVDQPQALQLSTLLLTVKGLIEGCRKGVSRSEQQLMRGLHLIEPNNEKLVFQRALQNVYCHGDAGRMAELKSGIEQIRDQADALRYIAVLGSGAAAELLKVFNVIGSRLSGLLQSPDLDPNEGESGKEADLLLGKATLVGDDALRRAFEEWERAAASIPVATGLRATGNGGKVLERLHEAYDSIGQGLLSTFSSPVEGIRLDFQECLEALSALVCVTESLALPPTKDSVGMTEDLFNSLEETRLGICSLKGILQRATICSEALQQDADSVVTTLDELLAESAERGKKQKGDSGSGWLNFFKKSKAK